MYCSAVGSVTRQDRIVLAVDRPPQAVCVRAAAATAAPTSFHSLLNSVIMKLQG